VLVWCRTSIGPNNVEWMFNAGQDPFLEWISG
jgi:hypothetical protein